MKHTVLHCLILFALITAGISPACAFIGGKGFIEICAADGSLQRVEVDGDFDPFTQPTPLSEHLENMEQCSYCFSMDHQAAFALDLVALNLAIPHNYLTVSSGMAIPQGANYNLYNSRAPPVFS